MSEEPKDVEMTTETTASNGKLIHCFALKLVSN